MKMIDVLNMVAKGEIENNTKLIVSADLDDYEYRYSKGYNAFLNKYSNGMDDDFCLDKDFLNFEAELIPPKEKKYLIKVNIQGLNGYFTYLNYSEVRHCVMIQDKAEDEIYKTHFTEKELQSIQPVREFLEDMEGKCELIEA